jgi:hypothetical protein
MTALLTILFNGLAYGVLLFIIAVGLSVTMGMMQFVNLAQVSFSMLGGYVMVTAMDALGIPFLASLPLAFVAVALFSVILERIVLRHFYDTDDLTQVLLTLGLVFMSISSVAFIWGPSFRPVTVPAWLSIRSRCSGSARAPSHLLPWPALYSPRAGARLSDAPARWSCLSTTGAPRPAAANTSLSFRTRSVAVSAAGRCRGPAPSSLRTSLSAPGRCVVVSLRGWGKIFGPAGCAADWLRRLVHFCPKPSVCIYLLNDIICDFISAAGRKV